ncbi:MAG: hypothetical protein CMH49_04750 [Myxococcales bacterium]|nr:hypothetical protein [Myxococcales bacterium]
MKSSRQAKRDGNKKKKEKLNHSRSGANRNLLAADVELPKEKLLAAEKAKAKTQTKAVEVKSLRVEAPECILCPQAHPVTYSDCTP